MNTHIEREPQFKDGDVVQLKSGSHPMTVEGYTRWGAVMVAWDDGKKTQKSTFAESALKPYELPIRKVAW